MEEDVAHGKREAAADEDGAGHKKCRGEAPECESPRGKPCEIYVKPPGQLSLNPEYWKKIDMSKVAGMANLNVHLHSSCLSKVDDTGLESTAAEPFFQYLSRFIKAVGGEIPLIVQNQTGTDCQDTLDRASTNTLTDESLMELTSVLDGPIYFFGREAGGFLGPEIEGRAIWTLPPEEFSPKERPDITKAKLLIFVDNLEWAIESGTSNPMLLVGRARVATHELIHPMRLQFAMKQHFDSLTWEKNVFGDWCISSKDAVEKIGTSPKLALISIGAKTKSKLPADAGRAWEHSVTGGHIFQADFKLVMAFKRPEDDASKIRCIEMPFSRRDCFAVVADPSKLIQISRQTAQTAEQSFCPAGHKCVTHMSCSRMFQFFQYKCGGSVGWELETEGDVLSAPMPAR